MIAPMPMLSVKKACPIASSKDLPDKLERSKLNKNFIASKTLVLNRQKTNSKKMTTNKIGMRISIASPRPFFTPPITTMTQKNKNTVCQKISDLPWSLDEERPELPEIIVKGLEDIDELINSLFN